MLEKICGDGRVDPLKKHLLMNISEILFEQGLLSDEEKNRMKVLISNDCLRREA